MKEYAFLDLGKLNQVYMPELQEAVERVLVSGRFIGGPECERFEKELCALTGMRYAVGVSNGLDALRLIFKAFIEMGRLAPGDEVIVPANTYIASVLAITDAGLEPVLVDPDIHTMNLSAAGLRKAIGGRTRAVLTVHLYGRPAWDAEMARIAADAGLIVVEDNAQAIGALNPEGRPTGGLGDAAAFSFYPTKNIGALGDAGAVVTSDECLARTVRALANYGSEKRYDNIYCGYNCRLDPVQAAVLTAKLPHLAEVCAQRQTLADIYGANIVNPNVITPEEPEKGSHVWHQYVVRTADASLRDDFRRYLLENGVGTDIHYATPPHRQKCYQGCFDNLDLPVTEVLADSVVSLPISSCTSPEDAREISDIINRWNP